MKTYKKSMLIVGSILFFSTAAVWEIDSYQRDAYGKRVDTGRSIASQTPSVTIIQKIDIRIYTVQKINVVVSADRALLAELNAKQRKIRRLLSLHSNDQGKITELKGDLAKLKEEMTTVKEGLEKKIADLSAEKEELNRLLAEAKAENIEVSAKKDEFQKLYQETQTSLEEIKIEVADLAIQLAEVKTHLEEKETLIAELERANCEKELKISKLEDDVKKQIADKEGIMAKLEELEEELASLEEEDEDDEGDRGTSANDRPRQVASNQDSSANMMGIQQMLAAFSQQIQVQQLQLQQQIFSQINAPNFNSGMDHYRSTLMSNMMLSRMMGSGSHMSGGWGMPSGLSSNYDYMLSSPTFSLVEPTYSPIYYDQGIPRGIGMGGIGRAPAITGQGARQPSRLPGHANPMMNGNIFNQVPTSL